MRIRILDTPDEVAAAAAAVLLEVVAQNSAAVVGWPTGRTAVPLYAELARLNGHQELDLTSVCGFNLDELVLPPGDSRSFAAFMHRHAWGRIGLDRARCDIPSPDADPAIECKRYDAAIEAAGGLDLAILGLGVDGHVAYNLPGPPMTHTHVVVVPDSVADDLEVPQERRPLQALTMGLGPLREAGRVLLIAIGERKRRAVRAMVEGPSDRAWPCSLLRGHADLDLVMDKAAAGRPERR